MPAARRGAGSRQSQLCSGRASLLAVVVLAELALVAHAAWIARLQGESCIDDAYISFRYAHNLLAGDGLVFNPGERVEGYTNFGWVMGMAAVQSLGLPVAITARALSLVCGVALVAVALLFVAARSPAPVRAAAVLGALLACHGALARWSQDGMETVLFALLVLLGAIRSAREATSEDAKPLSGLCWGLATLVRPEGALFFVVSLALRGARGLRRTAVIAGGYALIVGPHLAFRLSYYGAWLPNTFHAKVAATSDQVARGAAYLFEFAVVQSWPLLVVAALLWLVPPGRSSSRWQRDFLVLAAAHLVYVVVVGGDWMGAGRFVLPAYVLAATAAVGSRAESRGWPVAAVVAPVLVFTSGLRGEHADVARERPFLESRRELADWLEEHARPGDRLLTGEIGRLAYETGLATDDLYGLTDPRVATRRVRGLGSGKPGHEKADLATSLARAPDWVVIPGIAKTWRARQERLPELARYQPRFVGPGVLPGYRVVLERVRVPAGG